MQVRGTRTDSIKQHTGYKAHNRRFFFRSRHASQRFADSIDILFLIFIILEDFFHTTHTGIVIFDECFDYTHIGNNGLYGSEFPLIFEFIQHHAIGWIKSGNKQATACRVKRQSHMFADNGFFELCCQFPADIHFPQHDIWKIIDFPIYLR